MALSPNAAKSLEIAVANRPASLELKTAINNAITDHAVTSAITSAAAEINNCTDGQPCLCTIAAAAGGSNVCEVTFTVKDGSGTAVNKPVVLDILLSDAATGAGLTGTTASGAVAAKASSGTDLSTLVSKKALKVQTKADGTYVLSITDSAKTGFYPVAHIPGIKAIVGTQLVTGSYG